MEKFANLMAEGRIGSVAVKNRVVMPAMGTVLAGPGGEVSDHLIAYYSERAAGGTGLIISEVVCVESELGKATISQLRLDEDRFIPGFSRLASSVQKYGTRIFAQLHHAGNQSNTTLTHGKQLVAPSAVTNAAVGEQPRELSTSEVEELIQRFVSAAARAQMAGFDGVELHGAHGYLICQFLSPHTNQRSDAYGGSFENRVRFADHIIKGIKEKCGSHFPVIVRFSADEFTNDGITLEEGVRIARALEQSGADALDVSSGTYESMSTIIEPITYHEGWRSYLAEAVKKEVNIPVIAVGAIKRPDSADAILAEGKADFIAIGRGHLCDAEWTNKAAARREQLIVPCIGCMHCVDTIFSFRRIQCAVNARTGRELEFSGLRQDGEGRGVAVVGGGPAGMEAARVLKLRGFNPIVYEQRAEPGGELVPGCRPPDKEPIGWYRDSMIQNLKELGIQVLTGVEAEPRQIRKRDKPYAVFIAVGAKPLIPSTIPGLNQANVSTAIDILYQPESIQPDAKYVVVGGGSSGCETAELIASRGARVTIVEMLPELASRENSITRTVMLDRLRKNDNIEILTQHTLVRVEGQTVGFEGTETGAAKELRADHVVLSFGLTPMEDEVAQWREEFDRVHVVGDAVAPSTVANAVRTAFDAAYTMRVDDTWQ